MPAAASLADIDPDSLAAQLEAWGFPGGHAIRILRAHDRGHTAPDTPATRLPKGLAEQLLAAFPHPAVTVAARHVATDGTTKLLLRLADQRTIESVLMPDFHPDRAAGCLSSQVGCAMACDFCATAQSGFARNLTAGEMVAQFATLRREAITSGRSLRTLVFMGMGEPLLNLPNLLTAIRRIADNRLGGLGWRQITVSTVGIVPAIDDLAATGLNLHLAVSLHAPDDETRARLLPAGRHFPLQDILAAADRFQARRGRTVTLQYCLLQGVNDSDSHAHRLADLLAGRRMHVNLLSYNPTGPGLSGTHYTPASEATTAAFATILRNRGLVTHARRSRGPDIEAACGQLRRQLTNADPPVPAPTRPTRTLLTRVTPPAPNPSTASPAPPPRDPAAS